MKKSPRIFTASLVVMLFFSTHLVYGFKNPYWNTKGSVAKVKVLKDDSYLAIFQNSSSGFVELSHIDIEGRILSTAILSKVSQQYHFSTVYEYNGEYAVSMRYLEKDSTRSVRYQEFRFYNASLELSRAFKHLIDTTDNFDHLNDDLTLVATIGRPEGYFLRTVQFMPNGGKKAEKDPVLVSFKLPAFLKVIPQKGGTTVFAFEQPILRRFDFDNSLNLSHTDSFPVEFKTDSSGPLYRYMLVADIISINDSQCVGIFGDTTYRLNPGDTAIEGTYEAYLGKIEGNRIISYSRIGRQYAWAHAFVKFIARLDCFLKLDTARKEIHVSKQYSVDLHNVQYLASVRYSFDLDSLSGLKLTTTSGIDSGSVIIVFEVLRSGNYLIGGQTRAGNGLISMVDTTGLVSGIERVERLQKIRVFPNPGHTILHGLPQYGNIVLYNIVGAAFEIPITNTRADVSTLHSGVYFYCIKDLQNEVVGTGKWVKE